MIKLYQKLLNLFHVVLDAGVTAVSYMLALVLQFHVLGRQMAPLHLYNYLLALIGIIPVYLLLYMIFGLYRPKRVLGRRREASGVFQANALGLLFVVLVLYLTKYVHFSRYLLFYFALINTCMLVLERNVIRLILRIARKNGFNQKHVILVGYSRSAEEFIDRVRENTYWGYNVRGILDDNLEWGYEYKNVKVIGDMETLEGILDVNRLDEVIITLGLNEYSKLERIVYLCEKSGVHTKFIPDYNNIIPTKPYTEDLLGLPMVHIRRVPLSNPLKAFVKRTIDIVGSLVCIIVFSPVMLVAAIAVKTTKGPLIYCQERVGLHNRPFMMYKFRSMAVEAPSEEKSKWTVKNDPRVTKVGKFIRKTSVDELPQLFNVLKGDMSLIGPRPERPFFVEKFKEEIPRYMVKHQVRPGMTGWAQVNGFRGDTSIRKRIDCDLYYIENWTLGLDIKILFLTVLCGFVNKNAY